MAFTTLIVGLGNPGPKYESTRHNFGFMAADLLRGEAEERGLPVQNLSSPRKNCALWSQPVMGPRGKLPGLYLVQKPETYMNLSGEAAGPVCAFYKIDPTSIVVFHDELDLPLGRLKIKRGGSDAGHRGLASLGQCLGTRDYFRIRLGIGRPLPGRDVKNFVLERFSPDEAAIAQAVCRQALAGLGTLFAEGLEAAMRLVNGFDAARAE